jgi:hypothetical protein
VPHIAAGNAAARIDEELMAEFVGDVILVSTPDH